MPETKVDNGPDACLRSLHCIDTEQTTSGFGSAINKQRMLSWKIELDVKIFHLLFLLLSTFSSHFFVFLCGDHSAQHGDTDNSRLASKVRPGPDHQPSIDDVVQGLRCPTGTTTTPSPPLTDRSSEPPPLLGQPQQQSQQQQPAMSDTTDMTEGRSTLRRETPVLLGVNDHDDESTTDMFPTHAASAQAPQSLDIEVEDHLTAQSLKFGDCITFYDANMNGLVYCNASG